MYKLKPPSILVTEIKGKGRGIIADKDFKVDEVIEIAPALVFDKGDADILTITQLGYYFFGPNDSDKSILAMGYASLYNHDFKPNAWWECNERFVVIKAVKNIKANTEITIDYNWDKQQYKSVGIKIPKK